jgi:hypothetical protein
VETVEVSLAEFVAEPDDLEDVVAFDESVRVVVDGFAGASEESSGGVLFGEDQVGVGLAALKGDSDGHLSQRAAGEAVRAAEGLGAEVDVDTERSALSDETIQEQRGFLCELVVLDEEFLELVDEEEDSRHGLVGPSAAEAGEVLNARVAEAVAAGLELLVEALEYAQAEFAFALDGDDAGVRQVVHGIRLEFDAFLEVDEIQFDLVGAVPESDVRDQGMKECRLS